MSVARTWRTVVRGAGVAAIRERERQGVVQGVVVTSCGLDVETGEEWFQVEWCEVKP